MFNRLKFALCASTLLATVGNAQTYYSVDVTNDVLYTVNVFTGAAAAVGPLGVDLDGVDMAWHQGALYAKTFGTSSQHRIYQIVHSGMFAGTALGGSVFSGGGYLGAEIAGLASNGASLYITYSTQPPPSAWSTNFGTVNPLTGVITFITPLSTDADAMCFTGGKFWTMDVIAPGVGYDVFSGAGVPSAFVGNDTYDNTLATNPVDLEFFNAVELVTISQTGKNLVRVNRSTGARGTVTPITGLPSNGFLKGIAREPARCPTLISPQ